MLPTRRRGRRRKQINIGGGDRKEWLNPFSSQAARTMLNYDEIFVESLKIVYLKLLHRAEVMKKTAGPKSFGETYTRCCDDFEALLHDRLSDLKPALTQLKYLVADIERRVIFLENVRFCREGAAVMSPVGVHHSASASSVQSNRVCSTLAALGGIDQKIENASVRVDISSMCVSTTRGAGCSRNSPPR